MGKPMTPSPIKATLLIGFAQYVIARLDRAIQ